VTVSPVLPSVLVLDDDPDVAETIAAIARSVGAPARISFTASEFFDEWEVSAADVAIIDLQMPGRDGFDVIRHLGAVGGTQVILSSGCEPRILEAARHAARNSGLTVVGTLPKPVRRHALKTFLESIQTRSEAKFGQCSFDESNVINADTLKTALYNRQIRPYFQPKLRLHDRTIHGFEALVRLEHPELGLIQPDMFLPHVETHGLLRQMTDVVISQAVEFMSQLSDTSLTMAVNVPMTICSKPTFPDFLRNVLTRHNLSPGHLILEVTETGPLEMSQKQIDALTRLRMQGFYLSIDDFGTGVSSLERLVRIPFNELKIDRYFVREITTSPGAEKLVRNLVRIAAAMDMAVTIEGIEDAATMLLSEKLGCDFGQGYHIGKPMPGSTVLTWISEFSRQRWFG